MAVGAAVTGASLSGLAIVAGVVEEDDTVATDDGVDDSKLVLVTLRGDTGVGVVVVDVIVVAVVMFGDEVILADL